MEFPAPAIAHVQCFGSLLLSDTWADTEDFCHLQMQQTCCLFVLGKKVMKLSSPLEQCQGILQRLLSITWLG